MIALDHSGTGALHELVGGLLGVFGGSTEAERRLWVRALAPLQAHGCDIEGACGIWLREHAERPLPHDIASLATGGGQGHRTRDLVSTIAVKHGVQLRDIYAPTRGSNMVAAARQEVMAELHATGLSLPQIGRILGRDASSVWHGVHAHEARSAQIVTANGGANG
jgi:hypothetical protein